VLFSVDFYIIRSSKKVSKSFWIPPVTKDVIWYTLQYPFAAKFWTFRFSRVCFICAVVLILWGLIFSVIKRKKQGLMSLLAVLIYTLTLVSAIVLSNVIRPLLVERYIFPVVGLFVLAFAYGISMLNSKGASIFVCVALLAVSISQNQLIIEKRFNGPMKEVCSYINSQNITPEDVFIHTDEHTFGTFCYYYPNNKHYLYLPPDFDGYSGYDAFSPAGSYGSDIKEFIDGREKIWFVEREGSDMSKQGSKLLDKHICKAEA